METTNSFFVDMIFLFIVEKTKKTKYLIDLGLF